MGDEGRAACFARLIERYNFCSCDGVHIFFIVFHLRICIQYIYAVTGHVACGAFQSTKRLYQTMFHYSIHLRVLLEYAFAEEMVMNCLQRRLYTIKIAMSESEYCMH